jgi:hypothetical protein
LDDDGEAGPKTIAKINEKLNAKKENTKPSTNNLYRVRKGWENISSQVGAFANLANAKKVCDNAGPGYYVYDSNGKAVYAYANGSVPKEKDNEPVKPATTYSDVMIGSASKDEYGQYVGG